MTGASPSTPPVPAVHPSPIPSSSSTATSVNPNKLTLPTYPLSTNSPPSTLRPLTANPILDVGSPNNSLPSLAALALVTKAQTTAHRMLFTVRLLPSTCPTSIFLALSNLPTSNRKIRDPPLGTSPIFAAPVVPSTALNSSSPL